jgi:hypothetical protein
MNVLPELVKDGVMPERRDSAGNVISPELSYKTLNYTELIPFLIKGMQEQQEIIDSLRNSGNSRMANNTGSNTQTIELSSDVILYQNMPNPFNDETVISYFIPDNVNAAKMIFYDETGRVIKEEPVENRGNGSVNLKTSSLAAGVYTYALEVNGKIIQVRKMQKTR